MSSLSFALATFRRTVDRSALRMTMMSLTDGRLRGDRHPAKSGCELREDRQVGVQRDSLDPTHAQRQERPFVLQAAELALDRPRLL